MNENYGNRVEKVESAGQEYARFVQKMDQRLQLRGLPASWFNEQIWEDSAVGVFGVFLGEQGFDLVRADRAKIESAGLAWLVSSLVEQFVLYFQFFRRFKFSKKPEPGKRMVLFCGDWSTEADAARCLSDFLSIVRRNADHLRGEKLTVILSPPVRFSWKNYKLIEAGIAKELGADVVFCGFYSVPKRRRLGLMLRATYGYAWVMIRMGFRQNTAFPETEKKLFKTLLKGGPFGYANRLATVDALETGFCQEVDQFFSLYSFKRRERLFGYFTQKSGGTMIDLAKRIYTLARPSNLILESDLAEEHSIPNQFVVLDQTSKRTLCSQGIEETRIQVKSEVSPVSFRAYDPAKPLVYVFLQREQDRPIALIELIRRTMDPKVEIVVQLHPRFPLSGSVRAKFAEFGVTYADNLRDHHQRIWFAVTVFSSGVLQSLDYGIPIVWTPWLSPDSVFSHASMRDSGTVLHSPEAFTRFFAER